MKQEEAIELIISALQPSGRSVPGYASFGYDLYVPKLLMDYHEEKEAHRLSPVFFDEAWDLCRRGILRPGVSSMDA